MREVKERELVMGYGRDSRSVRMRSRWKAADVTEDLVFFLWMLGCAPDDAWDEFAEEYR